MPKKTPLATQEVTQPDTGSVIATQPINLSRFSLAVKRLIDILGAIFFFTFLGWLYIAVWITVILTTGSPAIYKHTRVGRHGKEFSCLKFRSMVVDSDRVLSALLAKDPAAREEWEEFHKLRNDPRITRFGQFIRKTSLDELPQFWNVLLGDMSLVGPRPVVRKELEERYGLHAPIYTSVRPGITGLWQISGRSNLSYAERVALDSHYVHNWSIGTDLIILFRTVSVVLRGTGSY